MTQLDLLSILDAGVCTVDGCDLPVSHTAVCVRRPRQPRLTAATS